MFIIYCKSSSDLECQDLTVVVVTVVGEEMGQGTEDVEGRKDVVAHLDVAGHLEVGPATMGAEMVDVLAEVEVEVFSNKNLCFAYNVMHACRWWWWEKSFYD